MAERSTHEIETPVGKQKVVVRDWLTGGEKRSISSKEGKESQALDLVKVLIVSIDGKTENVLDLMDQMHGKDFDFILTELGEVAEQSSYQKKTSS